MSPSCDSSPLITEEIQRDQKKYSLDDSKETIETNLHIHCIQCVSFKRIHNSLLVERKIPWQLVDLY